MSIVFGSLSDERVYVTRFSSLSAFLSLTTGTVDR